MLWGPKFGMFKSVGVGVGVWDKTLNGLTPAFLGTAINKGTTPQEFWMYDEASGATEQVSGGAGNLTDAGTPTKQHASTVLDGLTTKMGASDTMACSSSLVGEAANDHVGIIIANITSGGAGTFNFLVDKLGQVFPEFGFALYQTSGLLTGLAANATAFSNPSISIAAYYNVPTVLLYTIEQAAGMTIYLPGASHAGAGTLGPITPTPAGVFLSAGKRIGSPANYDSLPAELGLHAIFDVPDASIYGETERYNVSGPAGLGYDP